MKIITVTVYITEVCVGKDRTVNTSIIENYQRMLVIERKRH